MLVDVATGRVAEAMRRVGRALLEDYGLRRAEAEPAAPSPVGGTLRPQGVVWCGRARRGPDLQRFVDHLTSVRAADRAGD